MNNLHEQNHKRTSINELLNPVANGPAAGSLDGSYSPAQLAAIPSPPYASSSHGQQRYHSSLAAAGTPFSLRAASWDQSPDGDMASRQDGESSTSCRYAPAGSHPAPHQSPPHPVYADPYHRSRPVGEPANYGIDVSPWTPASHEPSPYGAHVSSPMYSDERTAAAAESAQKAYSAHPAPHYEHPDMQAQQAYANAYQKAERVSVRLAARSLQPQMASQHPMHARATPIYLPHHLNTLAFAAVPIMMPHPPPPKRSLEPDDNEAPVSKAKKPRGKAKASESNGNGASKRGYTAKKRNDSTPTNGEAAREKEASANLGIRANLVDENGAPVDPGHSLHPELQFARCMSNRYRSEEFPRCVSCTRRWAGDTCRFQGIRFFLKDNNRNIVGISFIESQKADGPSMNFPVKWNVKLELSHIGRIKRTVAQTLLPVLKEEEQHFQRREVIRRNRESEVRATCDTCMTSIFSTSWMCRLCGREACAECYQQVSELTTEHPDAPQAEIAALQAKREKHAHVNPFFLSCTRRNEHRASDFSPMSRFSKDELSEAIAEMEALLAQPATDGDVVIVAKEPAEASPPVESAADKQSATDSESDGSSQATQRPAGAPSSPLSVSDAESDKKPIAEVAAAEGTKAPEPSSFASAPTAGASALDSASIPAHEPLVFADSELTDEVFAKVWAKGEPLVVTDVMSKFRIPWTPEYFSQKYGTQTCLILECQSDQNKRVSVGEFFSWFGKYEGRRDCWKLKDWPPSTDFKTAFPELYEDFANGTPVPNYVRRDGVLNVASHFPSNTIAPDLGPKMYNAMASFESQGSKGSTRLHLDMADAVNIMLYTANTPDGKPGSAAWDLFKAEDSAKLRKFLKRKYKGQYTHDPIHSQQFYLDSHLRKELFDEYGVMSYRIYQKPGEAVFIPAGCAHQVCNLADCIKVACDFVSPENIARCEILTKEFREQNQSMAWKEDVLQLRTLMWFAWLSCTRQEKEMLS